MEFGINLVFILGWFHATRRIGRMMCLRHFNILGRHLSLCRSSDSISLHEKGFQLEKIKYNQFTLDISFLSIFPLFEPPMVYWLIKVNSSFFKLWQPTKGGATAIIWQHLNIDSMGMKGVYIRSVVNLMDWLILIKSLLINCSVCDVVSMQSSRFNNWDYFNKFDRFDGLRWALFGIDSHVMSASNYYHDYSINIWCLHRPKLILSGWNRQTAGAYWHSPDSWLDIINRYNANASAF